MDGLARVLTIFREVYHGKKWHNDERFKVHMVEVNGYHVYVGDIVEFISNESIHG